jgi:hypothetical protein
MKKIITLLAFIGIAILLKAQIPQSGLINRFTFDNTVMGTVGSNSITSILPIYGPNRNNEPSNALNINSANNATNSAGITGLPTGNNARTIAFWFKSNASSIHSFFNYGPSNAGFALAYDPGSSRIIVSNGITEFPITRNYSTNWTHLAVTTNSGTLSVYINGVLSATTTLNFNVPVNPTSRIGFSPFAAYYGSFMMDDLIIYNRALNISEINQIRNGNCFAMPINTTPIGNLTICEGQSVNLTVTGNKTIKWFNTLNGTTPFDTGNSITTPVLNRDTIFYALSDSLGCTSERTAIAITVIPLVNPSSPSILTDTNSNYCIGNRVWLEASATNGLVRWYNLPLGGNILDTGRLFLTPTLNENATYYVENSTKCGAQSVSPRLPILLKVNGNGDLINSTPNYLMFACSNFTNSTQLKVSSTSNDIAWRWSGPIFATGKEITTPSGITRDTTFWAIAKQAGSCTATLPLRIKSYGYLATAPSNQTQANTTPICPGDTITLKATSLDLVPLIWRNSFGGIVGSGDSIRIPNSKDGKFTVRRGDGWCASNNTNVNIATTATPLGIITYSNDTIKTTNTFDSYKLFRNGVEVASGNTGSFAVPVSCGEYRATFTNTANTCGSFSALVRRTQIPAGPGALCYYYDFQSFNGLQFPALMSWALNGTPAEPSMPINQTGVTTTSNWICPASGTLNVRIKSANGCYYNASFLVQNITNIYNQIAGGFQGVDSLTTCTILSNILNVTLPASINISTPSLVCNGSTAQFTGNITVPGNIVWYDKATGGSPINTGNNFTTAPLDTLYSVYAARNYMGCESQRLARTANVQGKINAKISSSSDTVCENSVIQLTASNDLPNATYVWNNGLGSGALKSFRPSQTDSFRVVATVNGCRDTAYKYITVKSKSSYQFKVTQCAGTSYTFNGQTLTSSNTYEVTLRNAAGCDSLVTLELSFLDQISNQINVAICSGQSYRFNGIDLTSNGTYRDTLKSVFSCDSIVILNLSVNPLPTPTITQNGQELSTENFSFYQWKLNNNNIVGANNRTFTPTAIGNYTVEVADNNSCKNESNPFVVSSVGLLNLKQLNISIYPNPAKEQFSISHVPTHTKIQLMSIEGKVLFTKWSENETETIDTKDWLPGIYLVSLEIENRLHLSKIQIMH